MIFWRKCPGPWGALGGLPGSPGGRGWLRRILLCQKMPRMPLFDSSEALSRPLFWLEFHSFSPEISQGVKTSIFQNKAHENRRSAFAPMGFVFQEFGLPGAILKAISHVGDLHSYACYTCKCLYMRVHARTCMYKHVHACTHVFIHVHTCTWIYMDVHGCS